MQVGLGVSTVAKKGRPKKSEREDGVTRYDKKLMAKARQVAISRGISLAEYLSEITRATVDRDYARLLRDIDKEGDA